MLLSICIIKIIQTSPDNRAHYSTSDASDGVCHMPEQ
jgi:hypothetical protein